MIFGGSPICVAAPPMLENITSLRSIGMGSSRNTFASEIVTGAINNIVVTLSKNAENTAVTKQRITTNRQTEPPDNA